MNQDAATSPSPGGGVLEVIRLVRQNCGAREAELVCLAEASRRTLRETVRAPEDQPPFDRSAMDGYAILREDGHQRFEVVDSIRAGEWKPRVLQSGQAVRIATGGALPGAGLQVVMKEDVALEQHHIAVLRRSDSLNIRFRGEDARRGQVLIRPGTVLGAGALALLASLGHTQPRVTRVPQVLHAVTGDEIVPPEQSPGPGQIRDSNSVLVRGFLGQFGIVPRQLRVSENQGAALAAMTDPQVGLESADLLLISGGASVGEHDFTRALLESLGYAVHLCKTNTRPGKPLIFATRGAALAFGIPGNPLAHFVCLNLYVAAALECMAGRPERKLFGTAMLARDLEADGNPRETLWPAEAGWEEGRARATPLPWSSSGDLTCLATANGLMLVPAGCRHLAGGSLVPLAMIGP